jgi:hypothetical protein
MSITYCMTSNCPLARDCLRYEDDVARHAIPSRSPGRPRDGLPPSAGDSSAFSEPGAQPGRTYADFSEELIRRGNGQVECPFFLAKPAFPEQL